MDLVIDYDVKQEYGIAAIVLAIISPLLRLADPGQKNAHLEFITQNINKLVRTTNDEKKFVSVEQQQQHEREKETERKQLLTLLLKIVAQSDFLASLTVYSTLPSSYYTLNTLVRALGIHARYEPLLVSQIMQAMLVQCRVQRQNARSSECVLGDVLRTMDRAEKAKPKHFREFLEQNGLTGKFVLDYEQDLTFETKWECLSNLNSEELLDFYFEQKTLQCGESGLLGVMRYCLNNYLLAGEGQSVERAIKCISTKLAKRLKFDFKSVQITVGAMLMLNTQFICERNGKKLNTYMSAEDFIDMVQSYPGFVKEQFPAESLTQIYDSLKAKPLGVQIPGCVVFNSAGLLVVDAAYFAEGFQLIQIAQKVKLDYLKQKINFNQLDYFYQDTDRLEREEKLVGISFG